MKPTRVVFTIFFLLVFSGCSAQHPSFETLYQDHLAARDVDSQKYEEALNRYYGLLEKDSGRAGTHSNIGVLLNMLQKPEDALKSLEHALELAKEQKDVTALFATYYNLGVYHGKLKHIPEALGYYQNALELVPASNEVKTNIELLIQQQQKDQQQKNDQNDQKDQKDKKENNDEKKDQKDDKGDGKKNQDDPNKDKKDDKPDEKKPDQTKENSPKYKPRPFKGDQLSEGDVKKILGELRNQEQKIRANFDKKEKGKAVGNEKDW